MAIARLAVASIRHGALCFRQPDLVAASGNGKIRSIECVSPAHISHNVVNIMTDSSRNIGLFYGSSTCYTEMAAEKIQARLNQLLAPQTVMLFNIKDVPLTQAEQFDTLIFGISTWDFGELQEDWASQWDDVRELHLQDKTVALFGLGDQLGYTDWFQDALGLLHDELAVLGCQFIGYWPNQGYDFAHSKALIAEGEFFVGLCLDDENQYEQSDARIEQWCQQLVDELADM